MQKHELRALLNKYATRKPKKVAFSDDLPDIIAGEQVEEKATSPPVQLKTRTPSPAPDLLPIEKTTPSTRTERSTFASLRLSSERLTFSPRASTERQALATTTSSIATSQKASSLKSSSHRPPLASARSTSPSEDVQIRKTAEPQEKALQPAPKSVTFADKGPQEPWTQPEKGVGFLRKSLESPSIGVDTPQTARERLTRRYESYLRDRQQATPKGIDRLVHEPQKAQSHTQTGVDLLKKPQESVQRGIDTAQRDPRDSKYSRGYEPYQRDRRQTATRGLDSLKRDTKSPQEGEKLVQKVNEPSEKALQQPPSQTLTEATQRTSVVREKVDCGLPGLLRSQNATGRYSNWNVEHTLIVGKPWICIGELIAFCDKYEFRSLSLSDVGGHNQIVNEVHRLLTGPAPFDVCQRFPVVARDDPEMLWICVGRCPSIEYHLQRVLAVFRKPLERLTPDKQRAARQNFHMAVNELRLDISARITDIRLYDRLVFEREFHLDWHHIDGEEQKRGGINEGNMI